MRLILYPDTNAFYSDRFLTKPYSYEFLRLLQENAVEVRLSPVVVAETLRHAQEDAAERIAGVRRALRAATVGSVVDRTAASAAVDTLEHGLRAEAETALRPLRAHTAVVELPYPDISIEDLVARELERRRPTLLKDVGSIGLRDTVIWHNLLDDVDPDSNDIILVITNDAGFLHTDKQRLHGDLIDDLHEYGIDEDRVRVQRDLAHASVEIRRLRELISNRDAFIAAEILTFIGWLPQADWGGYRADDASFHVYDSNLPALPSFLAEPRITAATYLMTERIGSDSPATCIAFASLDIEGHMLASEFYADSSSEVELTSGDVDGWYVEVSLTREVRVELTVEVDVELHASAVIGYRVTWE